MSDALALIAHDLKNALGGLESELAHLIDEPSPVLAARAHLHCSELRRQFIQFLTLYGAEHGGLKALCEDESPKDFLLSMARTWQLKMQADHHAVRVEMVHSDDAPDFWYFDRRLVQLALDAASRKRLWTESERLTNSFYPRGKVEAAGLTRSWLSHCLVEGQARQKSTNALMAADK